MALEATHIRFAVDLKDLLKISNMDHYISGTVYPDSRYVTGVDRRLTHQETLIDPYLVGNDFEKGWAVHLICDDIQWMLLKESFPEVEATDTGIGTYVPEGDAGTTQRFDPWCYRTAVKIIQDVLDCKEFDVERYLTHLNYVDNPRSEDIVLVARYNRILSSLYSGPERFLITSRFMFWNDLALTGELLPQVQFCTEALL
ncbi:MAG TPA: hypothetical protein VJA22_01770, partial [Patescibacteria group bacterium]|nr:hypothetical protein [Patescibacteria group bacterium]